MAIDALAAAPAQSPSQLKAQLWADDGHAVHAVVMGPRVPDLEARLAAAGIVDHDCLRPGALTPDEAQQAAYMVPLARDAGFTDWLLFEAAAGLGDWGAVVRSAAPRMALRSHLRGLSEASLPGGQPIELAWMDPEVALAVLPLCDPASLDAFMGPLRAIVLPRAAAWTTLEVELGQLRVRHARLAAAD
jgi:hypothetical protein